MDTAESRSHLYWRVGLAAALAMLILAGCGNVDDRYRRNLANQGGGNPPPPQPTELTARIFSPSWARVGQPMELDGSPSSGGSAGGPSTFSWALLSAPTGSSSTIINSDSMIAEFTPDMPGQYEFRLAVSDASQATSSALASTAVVPPATFVSRLQSGLLEWSSDNDRVNTIRLDQPVDLSRTLFMMTLRSLRNNPRMSRYTPYHVFIDNQTVEIRLGALPNDPVFVAWTVVEFTPETVIGVQRGLVDRAEGADGVLDILLAKPVDPQRTMIITGLHQTGTNFVYENANAFTSTLLGDGATLRMQSRGQPDFDTTRSQWQLVEFTADSGVEVGHYELDIRGTPELQRFAIEQVGLGDSFLVSAGNTVELGNSQFPSRNAFQAYFADPETIEVRRNTNGTTRSEMKAAIQVVTVAGALVQPFAGTFTGSSAVPSVQPAWAPINRQDYDPVVMSGWNAYQFVWGSADNTRHTGLMYTVLLNENADGVQVERGSIERDRWTRDFNGYVVGWPRYEGE